MKTAEEYFAELNNGKTPEQMIKDQEFIGALWAAEMMQKYAEHYHQQKLAEDCNRRELLCAFFKYFRDNGEANIGMTIEKFVDEFLST